MSAFDFLYKARDSDKVAFHGHWCGPTNFEHCKQTLIASYGKHPGGDGQTAEVFCVAMPARFYVIKALAGVNSVNEPKAAYTVSTGSDCAHLAASIAKAISEGMLAFKAD